jgi:hypothetical protein
MLALADAVRIRMYLVCIVVLDVSGANLVKAGPGEP